VYMLKNGAGDADPARFRQRLQTSRYVDPVSLDIILGGDDVTEIDPDAQFDPMRFHNGCIPMSHRLLKRDSAGYSFDRAGEFGQDSIAFDPDDPPRMSLDAWPNGIPQYALQAAPGAYFVLADQPAIADHVGKQYCCQTTLQALLRFGPHWMDFVREGPSRITRTNGVSH
jgi:hypothetical protein